MAYTARPSSWAIRQGTLCLDTAPICPTCGKVFLGRTTDRDGYSLKTCDNPLGIDRKRCGQHLFFMPVANSINTSEQPPRLVMSGLVMLYALEGSEFSSLMRSPMTLEQAVAKLGALTVRDTVRAA